MSKKKFKTKIKIKTNKGERVVDRNIELPDVIEKKREQHYIMAYLDYIDVLDGVSRISFESIIEDKGVLDD